MFSKLKIIPFLIISILASSQSIKNEMKLEAVNSNTTLVKTVTGQDLVTSKIYKGYEIDEWLLTLGGGDGCIGMNSFSASTATLGNWSNLMAWDTRFNSTTKYVTALISKVPMKDITSISISRSGASYFNYANVCAYLVASDSLDNTYTLVAEIPTITTTNTTYSFQPFESEKFFALVFYNPNGVFALGGVEVSFYSRVGTLEEVTNLGDLYYGAKYVFYYGDKQISDYYSLRIGSRGDTFCFYNEENGMYLSTNTVLEIVMTANPTFFTIDSDKNLAIRDELTTKYLNYDVSSNKLHLSDHSNISVYLDTRTIDHNLEVELFTEFVLLNGEHAKGRCHEVYQCLIRAYNKLSTQAKSLFLESNKDNVVLAKERLSYLSAYYERDIAFVGTNKTQQFTLNNLISIIIVLFSLLGISAYFLLNKKQKFK